MFCTIRVMFEVQSPQCWNLFQLATPNILFAITRRQHKQKPNSPIRLSQNSFRWSKSFVYLKFCHVSYSTKLAAAPHRILTERFDLIFFLSAPLASDSFFLSHCVSSLFTLFQDNSSTTLFCSLRVLLILSSLKHLAWFFFFFSFFFACLNTTLNFNTESCGFVTN